MTEISHELTKDPTVGTKRYYNFAAKIQAVLWWLHTPRWSKINKSDYGHRFIKYQNESMTRGILQDIESEAVIDIEADLDIKVIAVYATASQDDSICNIAVAVSDGNEIGLIVDRFTA